MTSRTKIFLVSAALAVSAAAASAAPAFAQASANVAAGAKVLDPQGGEVGTIAAVDGEFAVLKTDKHEVRLPIASFGAGEGGVVLGLTREQVNAQVDQALAAQGPLLTVGATLRDTAGAVVGIVEAFDAESATVKLADGSVRIPVSAIGRGPNGPIVAVTAAELQAQAAAASEGNAEGAVQ